MRDGELDAGVVVRVGPSRSAVRAAAADHPGFAPETERVERLVKFLCAGCFGSWAAAGYEIRVALYDAALAAQAALDGQGFDLHLLCDMRGSAGREVGEAVLAREPEPLSPDSEFGI